MCSEHPCLNDVFFLYFQIDILIFFGVGGIAPEWPLDRGGWVGGSKAQIDRTLVQVQIYRGSKITCSCRGILTWWSLEGKRFPVEVAGIEMPEPRLNSDLISTKV